MGRKINTFSKAIKHLKSSKYDMLEAAPTNNTMGFMSKDVHGFDTQTDDTRTYASPDFTQDDSFDDTSGLFEADGTPKTALPGGDTSYILGPMSAMWYSWANYTQIGYIREADRRMVNLGRITGQLGSWDQESNFYSYGQLTLEQAQWFYNVKKYNNADNDTPNYRAFYPGPPSSSPDEHGRYLCVITGEPKQTGGDAPIDYKEPPTPSALSPDEVFAALVSRLGRKGKELWDNIMGGLNDKADNLENFFNDVFDDSVQGAKDFRDSLQDALNDVKSGGKDVGNQISTSIEDAIDNALDYLSKPTPDIKPSPRSNKGKDTGVDNAGRYTASLAAELPVSIVTGQPREIKVSKKGGIDMANSMDVDAFADALTLDKSTPMDAENTINPKGKTDQVLGNGWDIQGGATFNFNTETGKLEITANKTLRTTSGGEQVKTGHGDNYEKGDWQSELEKGEIPKWFSDIPELDRGSVDNRIDKVLKSKPIDNFLGGLANIFSGTDLDVRTADWVKGPDGKEKVKYGNKTYNNGWDYMKDHPKEYQQFKDQLIDVTKGTAEGLVQGTGSNAIAIRHALQNFEIKTSVDSKGWKPFAQNSDVENIGGAYGQVSSKAEVNFSDLSQEVQQVIIDAGYDTKNSKQQSNNTSSKWNPNKDEKIAYDPNKGTTVNFKRQFGAGGRKGATEFDIRHKGTELYKRKSGEFEDPKNLDNVDSEIKTNLDKELKKFDISKKGKKKSKSQVAHYEPQGELIKESYGLRKVKFVMEDVAAAPAPTTPTNQTTTQQPTESKQTADALAKEYVEKNGPEKTKELIDKTDEYLSTHGQDPEHHSVDDKLAQGGKFPKDDGTGRGSNRGRWGSDGPITTDSEFGKKMLDAVRGMGNLQAKLGDYVEPDSNYAKNIPSWFTFSGFGRATWSWYEGKPVIWGYNYSGGRGYITPGGGSGDPGTAESGYGTPGFDWETQSGGTSWKFVLHTPKAKPEPEKDDWMPKDDPKIAAGPGYIPPYVQDWEKLGGGGKRTGTHQWEKDKKKGGKIQASSGGSGGSQVDPATGANATDAAIASARRRRKGVVASSYKTKGRLISESRKTDILKNLKNPVVIPEEQKKFKVKPKIRGLKTVVSKPVETPKEYKKIGGRNLWGKAEYDYNTRQSQERKNETLELLGASDHHWEYMTETSKKKNAEEMAKFYGDHPDLYTYMFGGKKQKVLRKEQLKGDFLVFLVDENGVKSNMLQSKLNEKLAEEDEKRILDEYNKINPKPKEPISFEKDYMFKKAYQRLKPQIDYKDKPAKKGYPDQPPPEMVNDRHPDFGKRPGTTMYNKLDPHSAAAMPQQDDEIIDAKVAQAKENPKRDSETFRRRLDDKIKKKRKTLNPAATASVEEEKSDWRKELQGII